jgi:hypothetical protein
MTTETEGTTLGRELIAEGYTHDSMGLGIDPNAHYDYRAIPYTEITHLWRTGLGCPRDPKPIMRRVK